MCYLLVPIYPVIRSVLKKNCAETQLLIIMYLELTNLTCEY
jgi:hypothetical protein